MREGLRVLVRCLEHIETAPNQVLARIGSVEAEVEFKWFLKTSAQILIDEVYLALLRTRNYTDLDFIIFDFKISMCAELLDDRLIRLFYESLRNHFQTYTWWRY